MEWTFGWWQVSIQRIYPTSTELSQTYNNAATWWHQHLHFLGYRRAYQKLWKSLKKQHWLNTQRDKLSICDCGIGTAAFSLAAAQSLSESISITGVDLSPEMLNQAHQRLSQSHISHQLIQGNATHLPFANESFDAVICAHMLEHLSEPLIGLKEIYRVLRSGGSLVLVVTRSGVLGSLIQWRWGNHCFTQKELSTLIRQAGFVKLQYVSLPIGLARFTSIACIAYKRPERCFRDFEFGLPSPKKVEGIGG